MFDDLNKNPEGQGEAKGPKPVEDIFSNTDEAAKIEKPAVFQPKMPEQPIEEEPQGFDKRYFILGFLVLCLIAVGAGGFYFYKQYKDKKAANVNTEEQNKENDIQEQGIQNQENQPIDDPAANTPPPMDQDQDGLTDEEEQVLGTDSNNIDTDADGLFDREEAKVYKTNPLNPDTDGDGHQDGIEVKNGFNPNGPGKLFEVAQ